MKIVDKLLKKDTKEINRKDVRDIGKLSKEKHWQEIITKN